VIRLDIRWDCSVECLEGGKGPCVGYRRGVTGGLCGKKTEWAWRLIAGLVPVMVTGRCGQAVSCCGAAYVKYGLPKPGGGRHAESDICDHGLEREQTGQTDGQKAA
jgi:hypothetical protein